MLLSKIFTQPEPVFQPVVVSPATPPPASAVDNTQPFQPQSTDHSPATNQLVTVHQQPAHRPKTDNRPSTTGQHQQPTNPRPTLHQQPTHRPKSDNQPSTAQHPRTDPVDVQQTPETDMDTGSDSEDCVVHEIPTGQTEEGELLYLDLCNRH